MHVLWLQLHRVRRVHFPREHQEDSFEVRAGHFGYAAVEELMLVVHVDVAQFGRPQVSGLPRRDAVPVTNVLHSSTSLGVEISQLASAEGLWGDREKHGPLRKPDVF